MKTTLIISLFLFFIFSSCDNMPGDSKPAPVTSDTKVFKCYRYTKDQDTVSLKTIDVNGVITGLLIYNFYEKDRNAGTIMGKMQGDLLVVDYTFTSEGVSSKRQVAFKKIPEGFTEGYGEMAEVEGRSVFRNIDSLNFTNSIVLQATYCEN